MFKSAATMRHMDDLMAEKGDVQESRVEEVHSSDK